LLDFLKRKGIRQDARFLAIVITMLSLVWLRRKICCQTLSKHHLSCRLFFSEPVAFGLVVSSTWYPRKVMLPLAKCEQWQDAGYAPYHHEAMRLIR